MSGSDSTRSPSGGGRAFSVQPVASSGSPPAAAAAASTKADDLKPLPNLPHYTVTGASQADNRLRQFAHNLFMFRRKSADGLENDSVPMDGAGRAAGNADTGAAAATSRRRLAVSTKSWRDMKAKSTRRYKRLVFKNGECNISHYNIKKRKRRFLADIFTTLVDIKWRYALLLFTVGFIASWLFFSLFWLLICFSHGDLDEKKPKNFVPCVENVNGFTDALLFSIETQHTIGYGFRYPSDRCPEAVLMVMVQSCFGVIIQALMTGLVFAKLSRPKKRAETLMFSKNAVICKRDGQMVLLFRVGDMRKSQLLEAHVRGILIKKRITREGEVLPLEQFDIDLGYGEGYDRLFLVWPIIVEHKITKDSPFWEISSGDLLCEQFELIVILEGIIESTGMTTQARSSYLPSEIRWGHRFERLITYQKDNGEYQINYEKFHATREIPRFPRCSAKDLADLGEENFPYQGMIDDDQYSLASRTVTSASNLHSMILPKQQSTRDQESAPLHQRKSAGGASTSEPGAGYTAVARSTAMPANSRPEISVRFNEPPQSSTQNSNHSPTAADAKPPPPAAVRRVRPHTAAAAAGPSCGAPFLDAQGNRTQPSRDPQHPSSAAGPANTTMTGLRRKKRKKRRPKTALGIEQQQQQTTSSSAAAGANGAAGGSEPNFPTLNPRVFHALRGFLTTESLKKTKFYSDREERMSSRRLQLDEQSERLKQRIGGFYQKLDSFIAETNKAAQWEPEDRRKQKSFLDDLDNLSEQCSLAVAGIRPRQHSKEVAQRAQQVGNQRQTPAAANQLAPGQVGQSAVRVVCRETEQPLELRHPQGVREAVSVGHRQGAVRAAAAAALRGDAADGGVTGGAAAARGAPLALVGARAANPTEQFENSIDGQQRAQPVLSQLGDAAQLPHPVAMVTSGHTDCVRSLPPVAPGLNETLRQQLAQVAQPPIVADNSLPSILANQQVDAQRPAQHRVLHQQRQLLFNPHSAAGEADTVGGPVRQKRLTPLPRRLVLSSQLRQILTDCAAATTAGSTIRLLKTLVSTFD
uniref:G protein-activated inward rectifier potassium channel 3 n=1 Tax=Macrostomum lignano TaxID=282301 RepID=A0A1I8IQI9_9PLAT